MLYSSGAQMWTSAGRPRAIVEVSSYTQAARRLKLNLLSALFQSADSQLFGNVLTAEKCRDQIRCRSTYLWYCGFLHMKIIKSKYSCSMMKILGKPGYCAACSVIMGVW